MGIGSITALSRHEMRKALFFLPKRMRLNDYLWLMAKDEMSKVETLYARRVPPAPPTSFLHGVYVASTARRTSSLLD
jgi:hypothetical protein